MHFRMSTKEEPRPIVVKCTSKELRNSWIESKRTKGVLNGSKISAELSGSKIDIRERLTSGTRELFRETRNMIKERKLSRSWIRNGNIYIRQSESGHTVRLRDLRHLHAIIKAEERRSSTNTKEKTLISHGKLTSSGSEACGISSNTLPNNIIRPKDNELEDLSSAESQQGHNQNQQDQARSDADKK